MRQLWLYDREAQAAEAAARADRIEEVAAAFGGKGLDKLIDTLRRR
jgi:hypothetical protein